MSEIENAIHKESENNSCVTTRLAIPLSELKIQEDGTIPLSSETQAVCMALATHLSKTVDVEINAYHVAAASMIAAKMPKSPESFGTAMDWVLAHDSTMENKPIPFAEITKILQTAHLQEIVDRLGSPRRTVALDEDGNPVIKSPALRYYFQRGAKQLSIEQGRTVTPYHLAVAFMVGSKGPDEDIQETLSWVIGRQNLENGSLIPLWELKQAAEAKQLPMLPPPMFAGGNPEGGELPSIVDPDEDQEDAPSVECSL